MTAAAIAFAHPSPTRIPVAIGASLLLHVGGMILFLQRAQQSESVETKVIEDIDLLERPEEKREEPKQKSRAARRKELAKNFFKMALPTRPKGLQEIKMRVPESRKNMMDVPKLKLDERKLQLKPDMKLDLNKDRPQLAKIDQKLDLGKRSAPAALPKLAEVGVKRAKPQILQLAKLAEERELSQRGLGAVKLDLGRRDTPSLGPKISAKTRVEGRANRLLSMLPEKTSAISLEPAATRRRPIEKFEVKEAAPLPTRKRSSPVLEAENEEKKAVEIEGPLSNRKVVSASVPSFPAKLEEYGVYQAEVAIKFFVSPVGNVLDERMNVEKSSSYGWLDRLAMTHLKKWRFEPLPMGGRTEWGIITFRFFLE